MEHRVTVSDEVAVHDVVFIKLTGPNRSRDMTTLVSSGTLVGGPQPGVFGVTSPTQLEALRSSGVAFEEVGRPKVR